MKRLLISLLLPLLLTAGDEAPRQIIPPKEVKKVLSGIRPNAIIYGQGDKEIHSFIDPKCKMSKRFMRFIMKNKKKMMKRYTYYFYLLELKRYKSKMIIGYIYDSENRNTLLRQIMLNDITPEEAVEYEPDMETEEAMSAIETAAKTIGVYKRPYIIYNGKAK